MRKMNIVVLMLFTITISAWGQLVFSVKPGQALNGASFGIKLGPLVLSGGLDYISVSSTTEVSGTEVQWTSNSQFISPYGWVYTYGYQLNPYSDKYEASVNIYAPSISVKLLLGGPENMDAYVVAAISKPFIKAKASTNGKDEDVQKYLDNLSVMGYQCGFGGEYFFSDNFSLGGEFGLRFFTTSYVQEDTNTEKVYVGSSQTGYQYQDVETRDKIDLGLDLGITYSLLTLNYYF
ncbi:MAG: hypothetical protein Q8L88_16175 [Bacteroidota bacterium]|nr:hypothetical protein [Bacteroidota bacterium]